MARPGVAAACGRPVIAAVLDAVRDAGAAIEGIRRAGFRVTAKADAGPVTEADRAADRLLRARLLAIAEVGWLSEETVDVPDRVAHDTVWVVDPLDGTKEFVEGIPEYAVAVALVERGCPTLGAIYNPATGDLYWATAGGGAFRNGRPLRVKEGRRLLASRSEAQRGEFAPFERQWRVDPVGSIEYKLAVVASGAGAVTLSRGPKWEWDVCAGALIVAEAGGHVSDAFGSPLCFNQPFPKVKGVLAGAPAAYTQVLARMKELGATERMDEFADVRRGRLT